MNKKQKIDEKILLHGFALKRLFLMEAAKDGNGFPIGPVTVSKQFFRLENKAHRLAEKWCNGECEEKDIDNMEKTIFRTIKGITGIDVRGIVFYNTDPRGYALKLTEKETKESNFYFRDWGGYGILAPDFREN